MKTHEAERDHALTVAALYFLAQQDAIPAEVRDVATDAGRFCVKPQDAQNLADRLTAPGPSLASIIGNLTRADLEALLDWIGQQRPSDVRGQGAVRRQARLTLRLLGLLGPADVSMTG